MSMIKSMTDRQLLWIENSNSSKLWSSTEFFAFNYIFIAFIWVTRNKILIGVKFIEMLPETNSLFFQLFPKIVHWIEFYLHSDLVVTSPYLGTWLLKRNGIFHIFLFLSCRVNTIGATDTLYWTAFLTGITLTKGINGHMLCTRARSWNRNKLQKHNCSAHNLVSSTLCTASCSWLFRLLHMCKAQFYSFQWMVSLADTFFFAVIIKKWNR